MTTTIMKYSLENIQSINANHFEFNIPETTINIINYLSRETNGEDIIKNPIFRSKIRITEDEKGNLKRKKINKSQEITTEEWEMLRTFQATKFEQKIGIDNEIDQIRSHLNKLTDKTYISIKDKIIKNIENILLCDNVDTYYNKIGTMIFDIASNNKFYSKIFADLYKELLEKYQWLNIVFEENYNNYLNNFQNIEYVEPNADYDRYCELNKQAEKRKSHSLFYVNLVKNGFLKPLSVYTILVELIRKVIELINIDNKKNEVDDLVENIALLFDKDIIEIIEDDDDYDLQGFMFNDTIYDCQLIEFIKILSECKVKDYKSLTNKTIFKFMDLLEL
jgi:hypothetical protein